MHDRVSSGPPDPHPTSHEARDAPVPARPFRHRARLPNTLRTALHDRLGPGLANLHVRLELLEEASVGTGQVREQIADLKREAAVLLRELARIVHDEPPERLAEEGLERAIAAACEHAGRPGLDFSFTVSGPPRELFPSTAELLYRAALEGTANVARHAGAGRCHVRLVYAGHHVILEISDDGHGVLPGAWRRPERRAGLGLASLQRAARALGGSATLESRPGGGARLFVSLPLVPAGAHGYRERATKTAGP